MAFKFDWNLLGWCMAKKPICKFIDLFAGIGGFHVAFNNTKRAKGYCELCANPGPFPTSAGGRFLEVYHVTPLYQGGPDTVDNVAAVCPNCQRACHFALNNVTLADRLKLSMNYYELSHL